MGASGTEFDAEYGADQIQILEGFCLLYTSDAADE